MNKTAKQILDELRKDRYISQWEKIDNKRYIITFNYPEPQEQNSVEEVVEEVSKKIVDLTGYGQALVPNDIKPDIRQALTAQYKQGYNQCLKDQKLTGEEHMNLYL